MTHGTSCVNFYFLVNDQLFKNELNKKENKSAHFESEQCQTIQTLPFDLKIYLQLLFYHSRQRRNNVDGKIFQSYVKYTCKAHGGSDAFIFGLLSSCILL